MRLVSSPALRAGVEGSPGWSGGLASAGLPAVAAAWRKGRNSSMGTGKIVVELFSVAISVTVWR